MDCSGIAFERGAEVAHHSQAKVEQVMAAAVQAQMKEEIRRGQHERIHAAEVGRLRTAPQVWHALDWLGGLDPPMNFDPGVWRLKEGGKM